MEVLTIVTLLLYKCLHDMATAYFLPVQLLTLLSAWLISKNTPTL